MKQEFNHKSQWRVVADQAMSQGRTAHAAPELARQIDERIHSENKTGQVEILHVDAAEGTVSVLCDDDFGMRMNDLPGACYAEKAAPQKRAAKASGLKR